MTSTTGTDIGDGPIDLQCTCALVRLSARRITQVYDQALKETGLRITQFSVLANLDRLGSLSITELAAILVMDRTTLTRNLRPLYRDGLVRLGDGPDKRSKALHLTPEGRKVLKTARPKWRATEKALRQDLGEADLEKLRALLGRLPEPARG